MQTFTIAKIIVVNDAGEVLVLRRSQSDERRPGQWDFPGGWVETGEDILAAVKREAQEEAGLTITDCKLVFAFSEPAAAHGCGTWLAYLARITGRPDVTLSYEHDAFTWMPLDKALRELTYERQHRILAYIHDNHLLDGAE